MPTPSGQTAPTPGKIGFKGILEFDDIRVGVTNFSVNFDSENPVQSSTARSSSPPAARRSSPANAFSASFKDRLTAEPGKDLPGSLDTEAMRATLSFKDGKVDAFKFDVDTLRVELGGVLTLTATDIRLDTGAVGTEKLLSVGAVGAEVNIGGLIIGGEARNFAILGNGKFKPQLGFGVVLSVGAATGDTFKWPSWLPIHITELGISWPKGIQEYPSEFVLTLSASVTGIHGIKGLHLLGRDRGGEDRRDEATERASSRSRTSRASVSA